MRSKNKPAMTVAERAHVERVAACPCSVCDASGPSQVHEIKQGSWWISVALCRDCHVGKNGLHQEKHMWRLKKMDELDALAVTLRRVYG